MAWPLLEEVAHLLEDAAVRVAEERPLVDVLDGLVDRRAVEQDGAEHGTFGFEVVGQRAFDGGIGHDGIGSEPAVDSSTRAGATSQWQIARRPRQKTREAATSRALGFRACTTVRGRCLLALLSGCTTLPAARPRRRFDDGDDLHAQLGDDFAVQLERAR